MPSAAEVRRVILEVIAAQATNLQVTSVLSDTASRLKKQYRQYPSEALLTVFYDLFRSGHLSWGVNLTNPLPPWFHTTDQGRETLKYVSRDPANQDGYIAHLKTVATVSDITEAYVLEALRSYNNDCPRAAAVMIGCAAESVLLGLRDAIEARYVSTSIPVPTGLSDWRAKRVLDSIRAILDARRGAMPVPMREAFDSYWSAFSHAIRTTRNDAGHPSDLSTISEDTIHASLLMFPELAKLSARLSSWVATSL